MMRDFYQEIEDIVSAGGETCAIMAPGDPERENVAHTAFLTTGVGALAAVQFTYSGDRTAFANPTIYVRNQFRTALPNWDGTNDEAETPDLAAWSRDDGSGEGFSIGFIARRDADGNLVALSKGRINASGFEWAVANESSDNFIGMFLRDQSASIQVNRKAATSMPLRQIFSNILTYDGNGGATAADGINIYSNGALDNGVVTNNASYVAMEAGAENVNIAQSGTSLKWNGLLGVLFFTYRVLTAVEVQNLEDIFRAMLRETPSPVWRR